MEHDLDEIRLKDVEELDDEDKKILVERQDELTDEERETFSEVVKFEEKEEKEEKEKEEEEEEEKPFTFGSQEEFDKAVDRAMEAREKARKEAEEREKQEKEEGLKEGAFFPEGYKAPGWDEAMRVVYPKFREMLLGDIRKLNESQRRRMDEIDKGFDAEIETIRSDNPDLPKKGSKEGDAFEAELADIGVRFRGVTNMTEAYDIYKETHQEGEGEDKGKVSDRQRELARKVSKGGGKGGGESKERKYKEIASRSMDDLLEERMNEEGMAE